MTKQKINIWGREFDLDVNYDCYTGEEILESQKEAVEKFVNSEELISNSLEYVKNYCISSNKDDIAESIDNIFKYVIPKYLFVPRNKDKRIVAVMCNYRFDSENGIAIVFENETFLDIGKQDIIL